MKFFWKKFLAGSTHQFHLDFNYLVVVLGPFHWGVMADFLGHLQVPSNSVKQKQKAIL